ncbi:MAG: relaxase domain-containing protein [Akkermansiaceae bacterium]|nr:relaxase domain-containing protein [Akkermansiaceae bacterium]
MLSIGKMSVGQHAYYDELAKEDYYLEGGEPPGKWLGQGATALNLSGEIRSKEFSDLFAGELRGKRLVQQSESTRCAGWDLTFSAPKSVSVAWSQSDAATAQAIREAQQEAVETALEYLEEQCGYTRRGKGGRIVEKAKCIFSTFEHGTSRAEQPQLHTHALLINTCVRQDGTTGTLKTEKLYQHKMTAGAIYRAELAAQLQQRLGLDIIRDDFSFKVAGVQDELCDHFSARRKEIEQALAEKGVSGAVASSIATLTTRTTKQQISRSDLIKSWKQTGISYGWSTDQLANLLGVTRPQRESIQDNLAKLSAWESVEVMMCSQACFTEKEAIRYACENAQGRGISAEQTIDAVREVLECDQLVRLGMTGGEHYYTTQEHLQIEQTMISDVHDLAQSDNMKVKAKAIDRAITKSENEGKPLTPQQEKAVRHILSGDGKITAITGDAGTGKTTILKPVREALEASGYQVRGLALAGKAAQGLEEGAAIESQTIARFLWYQDKVMHKWDEQKAKEDFKNWVEYKKSTLNPLKAMAFNPTWNKDTAKKRFLEMKQQEGMDDNTVLVVDEAAMVDTRSFAKIVNHVKESGAKLVCIGDSKQLQAITQGGAFQAITEEIGQERLTEVFRQECEEAKKTVQAMAEGNVREALTRYAKAGDLKVGDDRDMALSDLVTEWAAKGCERPAENLMLAATNLDVFELNEQAQAERLAREKLSTKSLKVGIYDFHENDRVVFTRNNKSLDVKNGTFGTVRRFNEHLGTISIEIDHEEKKRAQVRTFSVKDYADIRLGYAVTTHKSQGATVKNAFVLTNETMMDRQISYVQMSRAKQRTQIFTTRDEAGDRLTDLVRRMERDNIKELALAKLKEEQERKRTAESRTTTKVLGI